MTAEALGAALITVTVFLHAEGLFGLSVSRVGDFEPNKVFLWRGQVKILANEGFYARLEMTQDLAKRKGLV